MIDFFRRLFSLRQFSRPTNYRTLTSPGAVRVILAESSLLGIRDCIADATERQHEGIAYLYGKADGETTLIAGAIRPEASTTAGSFQVASIAMARIVRKISAAGLQLVGQAHSHPRDAFHSRGDEDGANIAYDGFVSIVFPDYGVYLPSLERAAVYIFRAGAFQKVPHGAVTVVPRSFP